MTQFAYCINAERRAPLNSREQYYYYWFPGYTALEAPGGLYHFAPSTHTLTSWYLAHTDLDILARGELTRATVVALLERWLQICDGAQAVHIYKLLETTK